MALPFFTKHIDDKGVFNGDEQLNKSADALLKELEVWAGALKTIRTV